MLSHDHKDGQCHVYLSLNKWAHAVIRKVLTLGKKEAFYTEIQRTSCHAHFI